MAFEDDMIEAGYSDEQEYLDRLIDDFEENYRRQQELEMESNNDLDSYYDEEEERERREKLLKRETEKQWVIDWKEKNPELAIIWQACFSTKSYYAELANMDNRHFMRLNEYNELKKWLNERQCFESERQKDNWIDNLQLLISKHRDELFKFYFPDDEEQIDMSLVSQQAHELLSIKSSEPSLWEDVISNYTISQNLFDQIEEAAFWEEIYNREMDYDYWKDCNTEEYNQFAKRWVADGAHYVYGNWLNKNVKEEDEWKQNNHSLWEKFKNNYEIRERNKYIESLLGKNKSRTNDYSFLEDDYEFFGDDYFDEEVSNPFLPDLESKKEIPYDINTLDIELRQTVQDGLSSLDMSKISIESSKYADKVLTQLWIYSKRDEWEMEEVKKRHDYLFRQEKKYSIDFLAWWKEKYQAKWRDFLTNVVPVFKNNFEVVMKFRQWALDGNKEVFYSLADKYLSYWSKTLKLMYGQDVHDQLCEYFYNESRYQIDSWCYDVGYIKKYASTSQEIDIWQKELRDKVIWECIVNENYQEHNFIEYMYTSLKEE